MPKIAVVTTLWKRPAIAALTLRRFAEAAKTRPWLRLVAAGSEGEVSQELAESHGWNYIEAPNAPLGAKWNQAASVARTMDVDAILVVGSDDWIDDAGIDRYRTFVQDGCHFAGLHDLYMWLGDAQVLRKWPGYGATVRKGETAGLGRLLVRPLLEKLRWEPWEPSQNRGLDGRAWWRIRAWLGRGSTWAVGTMEELGITAIAGKHGEGLTKISSLKLDPCDQEAILKRFPHEEVLTMRACVPEL